MRADVAEDLVEVPDAPRLSDDPGVQVEHHHAAVLRAIGVEAVEPVAPQLVDFVDRPAAVEVDVLVVQIDVRAQGIQLALLHVHLVGLLVIAPVADVADALRRDQLGGVRRFLEGRAGPADRPLAGRLFQRRDASRGCTARSSASDMPAWMMRRCEMP